MSHHHISTKPQTLLAILESLTTHPSPHQTTVIVCNTKQSFLIQLQHDLSTYHSKPKDPMPATPTSDEDDDLNPSSPPPVAKHSFLTPTLHLLAVSRNINLVFCPTVSAFRAFVSIHTSLPPSSPSVVPKLLILNVLALHQDTSEFTMQGLSRTFAGVASMAYRNRVELRIVECGDSRDVEGAGEEGLDEGRQSAGVWDQEVPLLSGSVRLGGAGSSVVGWAGRRVSVRKVAERWFSFDDEG